MTERDELNGRAERILGQAFGGAVRLGDGTPVAERDHVWRFPVLDGPSGAPASVIAKRARSWGGTYNPDSDDQHNPAWGILAEWHALTFLGRIAEPSFTPRLYGGDRQAGLVVLEDLGSGSRFDEALLGGNAAEAEAALLDLAAVLGRMHALTAGQYEQFMALGRQIGRPRVDLDLDEGTLRRVLPAALELFNLAAPAGLDADLAHLAETLQHPGPFRAYTHGDPCPDNWLRANDKPYLLDFERGAFRHALLDGVYGRIHFPTCWCVNRIPRETVQRVEDTYRAALAAGCPAAADDAQFGPAVVAACAYWVIDLLNWAIERPHWYEAPRPLARAGQWGIATIQQRMLVRAELLTQTIAQYAYFEAIGDAIQRIAAVLRTHWPASADEMPLYPAFRPGAT